jgi:demethylmenaquinone methyltransferase/2-methoxy-6-polyprenyl-1,4-benzoquinol methylase
MARVAAPNGRVAVLEFSKPGNRAFNAVYQQYFKAVLPRVGQWISGSRQAAYDYLPQSVAEFPCGPAMHRLFEQAGLVDVRSVAFTFGIASLYWGRKPAE